VTDSPVVEPFVIGWADPGQVSGWFAHSLQETLRAAGTDIYRGHFRVESGPRIAEARNDIVRSFLTREDWKDVEWLLMVDADMSWHPSAIEELFRGMRNTEGKVTHPVVGGLCFGGGHGQIMPTTYRVVDPATNNGSPVGIVTEWKEGEFVEVDATGAAFLLIHRGILEILGGLHGDPHPWFAEGVYAGRTFGEDWTFCMRVRTGDGTNAWPIYVATSAKVGHHKTVLLDETMWRTGQSNLTPVAPPPQAIELTEQRIIVPNRAMRRATIKVK